MRTIKMLVASATLALIGLSGQASAQSNLVTNGGFETGDFTGFTVNGDQTYVGVASAASAPEKTNGNYRAFFGTVGGTTGMSQLLSTTAGTSYAISFFLQNDGGNPNSAEVLFGDSVVFSLLNAPAFPLTQYSFNAVATESSTNLQFRFRQDPAFYNLDQISVTAASGVPEPATWAMMFFGFGAVGMAVRRRIRISNAKFDNKIKRITAGLEA